MSFIALGLWIPPLFQSIPLAIPLLDFYVSSEMIPKEQALEELKNIARKYISQPKSDECISLLESRGLSVGKGVLAAAHDSMRKEGDFDKDLLKDIAFWCV